MTSRFVQEYNARKDRIIAFLRDQPVAGSTLQEIAEALDLAVPLTKAAIVRMRRTPGLIEGCKVHLAWHWCAPGRLDELWASMEVRAAAALERRRVYQLAYVKSVREGRHTKAEPNQPPSTEDLEPIRKRTEAGAHLNLCCKLDQFGVFGLSGVCRHRFGLVPNVFHLVNTMRFGERNARGFVSN